MKPAILINRVISLYLSNLHKILKKAEKDVHVHQQKMLRTFIQKARKTEIGREFGFASINNYKDFARQVPVRRYDEIRTQVHRMMEGETNILWPGLVTWFATLMSLSPVLSRTVCSCRKTRMR